MLSVCLTCVVSTAIALPPDDLKPPRKLELFSKEAWYKNQTGKEQVFTGILKKHERKKGVVGFGRFNPYYLVISKKNGRDVYVGSKTKILSPYVGRKVKLIGKAVDLRLEGKVYREIWPARLLLIGKPEARDDQKKEQ